MKIKTTSFVSFSPKGSMMALGTKSKTLDGNYWKAPTLDIHNVDTGEVVFSTEVPAKFNRVEWKEYDGSLYVAGGLEGGKITAWNATPLLEGKDPKEIHFPGTAQGEEDITGLDFSHNMTILAAGTEGGKLMLWDFSTQEKPRMPAMSGKYAGISSLQWNKSIPQIMALGTSDGIVSIVDLRMKHEAKRFTNTPFSKYEITSLQWSPETYTNLAVASSNYACQDVLLFDLRLTKVPPKLEGHTDGIAKCCWSERDPSLMITCGCDEQVIAWDIKTMTKRNVILTGPVFDFVFSPEHPDMVAYASYNNEVKVDTLTSLNAQNQFFDYIPAWQKKEAGVCFTQYGLMSYAAGKLQMHKWKRAVEEDSCEWKILDAYKSDTPRAEILKIFSTSEHTTPIEEEEEGEGEEGEGKDKDKAGAESGLKIDEADPITEQLIHGDFSSAFKMALKEDARVAALIAMCDGAHVLKREKKRIMKAPGASSSLLLLLSVLSGEYNDLIDNNVDWKILVKILGKHCTDETFIPEVHHLAESLEKKENSAANLCYLISKDIQKYYAMEEKKACMPTSIAEASEFYKDFSTVFAVAEAGSALMQEKIQVGEPGMEYLKYLLGRGEKERVSAFLLSLTEESRAEVKEKLDLKDREQAPSTPSMQTGRAPAQTPAQQSKAYPGHHSVQQSFSGLHLHRPASASQVGQVGVGQVGVGQVGVGHPPMPIPPMPIPPMPTPPMPTPSMSRPPMPTPHSSTPAMPTPAMGRPHMPTPQMSRPPMPTPSMPTPAMPTPAMGRPPMPASHSSTPSMPTPAMGRPSMPTPYSGGMASGRAPVPGQAPVPVPGPQPGVQKPGPKISYVKTPAPTTPLSEVGRGAQRTPSSLHPPTMPEVPQRTIAPPPRGMFPTPTGAGVPGSARAPGLGLSSVASPNIQQSAGHGHFEGGGMGTRMPQPQAHMQMGGSAYGQPSPSSFAPHRGGAVHHPMQGQMPSMPAPGQGHAQTPVFPPRPGMGGARGMDVQREMVHAETTVTPEMEAVYARIGKVIDALVHIINHKKGSLKNWLLKTINPSIDVLLKQVSEKKWSPEFLKKMDVFVKKIEDLGVYTNENLSVSGEELDTIRQEGDSIVATRPVGTKIEVWMSAVYSLLKVALH
ncbi:protein transport protein SEC31 [Nematocida sp. AWRm77]|nr:protein transport protein SEC31 [Nematocida sp. AWRm77]